MLDCWYLVTSLCSQLESGCFKQGSPLGNGLECCGPHTSEGQHGPVGWHFRQRQLYMVKQENPATGVGASGAERVWINQGINPKTPMQHNVMNTQARTFS